MHEEDTHTERLEQFPAKFSPQKMKNLDTQFLLYGVLPLMDIL